MCVCVLITSLLLLSYIYVAKTLHQNIPEFYQMLTAPAVTVLNKWFESEPLKATLATDSVIGAMTSPQLVGSG